MKDRMKRLFHLMILALMILSVTGCIRDSVPRSHIAGSLAGKPVVLDLPKDVDLESLVLSAETNGTVNVTMKGLKTRMNPDVITTTGDAQDKMIKTIFDGAQSLIQSAPK